MIIVTGAAGFVGSNLIRALDILRYDYMAIDDLSFGNVQNISNKSCFVEADFGQMEYRGTKKDILVHLATSNIIYAMNSPIPTFNNNALKTVELFKNWQGKIVYTSTSSVYGNAEVLPTKEDADIRVYNAYDTSKRIAEVFLQERGNYTTLRLSNVYGEFQDARNPYCGVMGKMIHSILTDNVFTFYGNGRATRDYTYVQDVVTAIMYAIDQDALNTEINIGTGKETSVIDLAIKVGKIADKKVIMADEVQREIDVITRRCLSVDKAHELMGWFPMDDLDSGIEKTINWYAKHLRDLPKEVLRTSEGVR